MELLEVPQPSVSPGSIVVRNRYSVISAGTEGKTVGDARKSLIGKARSRQEELKKVVKSVQDNGLTKTFQMVSNRLEAPSSLGYSCVGEVTAVGDGVKGFSSGDLVACAGGSAAHAEVVSVPEHLAVKLPEGADVRQAAFTTLGAIALQGIRQADIGIGGNCVVIGLGLVGLLTMRLLESAGITSIGIDLDPEKVDFARRIGHPHAFDRSSPGLADSVSQLTRGAGVDAVIIAAATSSADPVDLAGELCRYRGKVVIVGAVPTGFKRPQYYKKELDLRMSFSYGPGRHDPRYEDRAVDYPIGFVRWTANRNMQAYVDLIASGRASIDPLITHTFDFSDAAQAYQLILDKEELFCGILLKYPETSSVSGDVKVYTGQRVDASSSKRVGFVGAGSFAQNVLLPIVKDSAPLIGVATVRPNSAKGTADKFGFSYATCDAEEIMTDDEIDVVFVATRHDTHADLVIRALEKGKHVFVEKPLCLNEEELARVCAAYENAGRHLLVGFNRRFAPLVVEATRHFGVGVPRAINYRINAGALPAGHWIHDPAVGGGRVVGEVCHFVDLTQYLAGARITTVSASEMKDPDGLTDTVSISLGFENGSTASIAYYSNGDKSLAKERIEVFCGGTVAVIDDFKSLNVFGSKPGKKKLKTNDKGHRAEVVAFLRAVETGHPSPIPFDEIQNSTKATLSILEAIRQNAVIQL